MTVFRAFLKIINKYKFLLIMYTALLIGFGGFTISSNEKNINFVASKPDILIINNDEEVGITKNLIEYMESNSKIVDIKDDEEAINDALFYRDVNYIIYIPENYRNDLLSGKNPEIEIKSTGDYNSAYAEMLLTKYVKVANAYISQLDDEDEIIAKINSTLSKQTNIEVTSKLDTNALSKAGMYYNFLNYSVLAGCIYLICIALSSFNEEKVRKRIVVSSMNYKKHNRILLLSNSLFAIIVWIVYVILSFILVGSIMFSMQGLLYILNSFVFTICAITIAFLISTLVNNKNALNGIINVIALGSSFLCGAFVPVEWLPDSVLKIAHILPSYWYIQTNELLKTIETLNLETLKPAFINMGVILIFSIVFVAITNMISKKKRKIG